MTGVQLSASPADSSSYGVVEVGALAFLDTTAGQVSVLVLAWMGIGVVSAAILHMRGHEFRPYAALGAVLGPAFVFLAYDTIRRRESSEPISISVSDRVSGSPILVVAVGDLIDGEPTLAAFDSVAEVGPVTVAVPVEYEVAERVHEMGGSPPDSSDLSRLAEALDRYTPGLMMLPGPVEKSIPAGVRETGAELVVIVGDDSRSVAPELETVLDTNVIRVDA